MDSTATTPIIPHLHVEQLRQARGVLRVEADALNRIAVRLDLQFCSAVELLFHCTGHVVVTGMGKAGLIGQKISATLSSTGTRSIFLHPADAVHGDLGCLHDNDVLLALSNSGETGELLELLPFVQRIGIPIVAVTASANSTLGSSADFVIQLGRLVEAGPHGLAPTTSTTAMLAVGDALALVVSRRKAFTPQQFAVFHPGGTLGHQLKQLGEVMRTAAELRIESEQATIRDVFCNSHKPGRRTGAVMLVDDDGRLSGLFTDSDFARLWEQRRDFQFDRPIREVMTTHPITIPATALLREAVDVLSEEKVSELPVVDDEGKPVGLIDITDVIGLMPADAADENPA
jgi:arabinose-5-phosphate isomerase